MKVERNLTLADIEASEELAIKFGEELKKIVLDIYQMLSDRLDGGKCIITHEGDDIAAPSLKTGLAVLLAAFTLAARSSGMSAEQQLLALRQYNDLLTKRGGVETDQTWDGIVGPASKGSN